ncbi:MAG: RagB/SusD family nutrient uptake outer membrane protein [Mangrovibacterium sp.]
MNSKIYLFGFLLAGLMLTSCNEDFLDKQPTDSLTNDTYWVNANNAQKAVTACYQYLGDDWWKTFLTCATDDSYAWSNWPCDIMYAANGSATTNMGTFRHFWSHYYQAIAAANNVIANIDQVPDLDETLRNRLAAEASVIRAYAYQQLVGLYGDVPLITTPPAGPSEYKVSRTPKAEVMEFISGNLAEVADDLPDSYTETEFGKTTKGAALALKARIDLYNGDFEAAAQTAKQVMDMNIYEIDPNYSSLFNGTNENSSEIILSAQYIDTYKNALATWVGGPAMGGWSEVVPLQSLVDAYECTDGKTIGESSLYDPADPFANRDPRLEMTIVVPGGVLNGVTIDITIPNSPDGLGKNNASYSGYYYKKLIPAVINGGWDGNSTNDIIILRYAEVLLTYAEAKIEQNQIDQSVYDAINLVRGRASVNQPDVTTGKTQAELREILRRERRVEFAIEEHRLFDIRRWEIADEVMPGNVYGILNYWDTNRSDYGQHVLVENRQFNANRDYLWPIPQSEMDLNENLVQNPVW